MLTAAIDNVTGSAGNDTIVGDVAFNSATALYDTPTLGAFDVIDGGAGTDTLTVSQLKASTAYTLPAPTIRNVENLVIKNDSGAVTADVQTAVGLQDVAITLGTAADVDVTTKSNVKSVTITKGTTNPSVTDNGSAATTADTLATVTLVANGANATISSDALTTLNLTNTAYGATVSATAGTRALTVNLNEVTGGTVTDATATTLNVNSTGKATTGVTLTAAAATSVAVNADEKLTVTDVNLAAAKTITVAGDSAVTISTTSDVGVLESVSSASSTGGLTITPVLATSVTFTGGAGKDTVALTAGTTKASTMGAGNDTVTLTGAFGAGGSVDAGDGTDTLSMTSADAETVSATTTFEAGIANFEKLKIGAVAATATDLIQLANIDDINYVVSAGTAAGSLGTNETAVVTFSALEAGQSITVAGLTLTATGGALTAAQVAEAFDGDANGTSTSTTPVAAAVLSGSLSGWVPTAISSGTAVTFTASTAGNVTDIATSVTNHAAPTQPVVTVTQGSAPGSVAESGIVTLKDLADTKTVTIAGVTITNAIGSGTAATAAQIATVLGGGTVTGLTITGGTSLATQGWALTNVTGPNITLTATTLGNKTDFTVASNDTNAVPTILSYTQGVDGVTESASVVYSGLKAGQSITVAGVTLTATGADLTAAQVAEALDGDTNGYAGATGTAVAAAVLSGTTFTGYNAGAIASGSTVVYTSTTTNQNIPTDLTAVAANAAAPTATPNTTDGGAGGTAGGVLNITGFGAAGTLELTGAITGNSSVALANSGGTSDVFNLKLNGANQITNTATLTVAGVETINIEATDSAVDAPDADNPAAVLDNPSGASKVNLVAADATKIVVTGNHGVDFTGSTLAKVVELDASGVVSVGDAAGATAATIGAVGQVTFSSQIADKAVTVKTGNGYDVINVSSINDATFLATNVTASTIDAGAGNDNITGSAGKDVINGGDGKDTIYGAGAADTLTGGAGNDTFVYAASTDSTLAKTDVITDFVANTYGNGTSGAAGTGASTDATKLTGDVLKFTGLSAAVVADGAYTFVATNAADAQTFIQNTAIETSAAKDNAFTAALDSTTGKLYIDLDSNGTVDSVIQLTGVTTITAAAFELTL